MRKFLCAKMRSNLQKFLHFFKFYRNILKYLEIFFNKSSKNLAFTLVELMISLVIISLIAAAFAPVITKKLSMGSVVSGGGKGMSTDCAHISDKCSLCQGNKCLACNVDCGDDATADENTCTCKTDDSYYVEVDGLLVTKYNMGDNKYTRIPTGIGINTVNIGATCGSKTDYSTKCCWQGKTSGTSCNSTNGSYSGCDRTVCNWAAANAICESYNQDGRTWRLATTDEIKSWDANSINKSNEGLMLCDYYSGYLSAYCDFSNNCLGSYANRCYPYDIWSGSVDSRNSSIGYYYRMRGGSWEGPRSNELTYAYSVRCVTPKDPNCKTLANGSCTACKDGYYLSNGTCKEHTNVDNCSTYSTTEDKCAACNTGYNLNNNKCEEDAEYYININGLLVVKYNMGDHKKTQIPTSAGVDTVGIGKTCGTSNNYSIKCCWRGDYATSSGCDATNGSYSGCNRTACNWAAANAICESYSQDGRTWRLPTTGEMSNWGTYSKSKGDDGLMLCDSAFGYSSAYCNDYSTFSHYPYYVWSGLTSGTTSAYYYTTYSGSWYMPGNGDRNGIKSVRCVSELVPNCSTYSGNTCTACKSGYKLSGNSCVEDTGCPSEYSIKVGNVCVTKYNVGDGNITTPAGSGVTTISASTSCGTSKICCWRGSTSNFCNDANGSYSGCNRTVCEWKAADAICGALQYGGKSWRLPTASEAQLFASYSVGKSDDGLMLCDVAAGYNSASCDSTGSSACVGSYNGCFANHIWTSDGSTYSKAAYYLQSGSWKSNSSASTSHAFSVRCVTDADNSTITTTPNCATYSGSTCTSCNSGYYLYGGLCYKLTTVENCVKYSATSNQCTSCKAGYRLQSNSCVYDPTMTI